ncbi:hypothetical protein PRIPAC_84807, partial [Pristionchus pacificus]|uniref:Uncharacterized protein n=1 Tax=Pristionchus pacificus TaxID=54126 RepID=A0A2A6CEF4_PRIPA
MDRTTSASERNRREGRNDEKVKYPGSLPDHQPSTARMGRTTSTSETNRYEGGKDENVKVHVDEIASTPTKEGPSHADQGIQKL